MIPNEQAQGFYKHHVLFFFHVSILPLLFYRNSS